MAETNPSALHTLAHKGAFKQLAKLLRKEGESVNARDQQGRTFLHIAAQTRNLDLARFLLQKYPTQANVNAEDRLDQTPLHVACSPDDQGEAADHSSKEQDERESEERFRLISFLLENGADVSKTDRHKNTPLHLFAQCSAGGRHGEGGEKETADEMEKEGRKSPFYECILEMIARGADVNAVNDKKETPLHVAARKGNGELMLFLIDQKADIDALNAEQETCLHLVARAGNLKLVDTLLHNGADPEILGLQGTPSDVAEAAGHRNVVALLDRNIPCITYYKYKFGEPDSEDNLWTETKGNGVVIHAATLAKLVEKLTFFEADKVLDPNTAISRTPTVERRHRRDSDSDSSSSSLSVASSSFSHKEAKTSGSLQEEGEEEADEYPVDEEDEFSGEWSHSSDGSITSSGERRIFKSSVSAKNLRNAVDYYTLLDDFLLTYRSFCTPRRLLSLLIIRFRGPCPNKHGEQVRCNFQSHKDKIWTGVAIMLNRWLATRIEDFVEDIPLQGRLKAFMKEVPKVKHNQAIRMLRQASKILRAEIQKYTTDHLVHPPPVRNPGGVLPKQHFHRAVVKFAKLSAEEIAHQLTLQEYNLISAMRPHEFLRQAWLSVSRKRDAPNVLAYEMWFKQTSYWVITEIITQATVERCAAAITKFVQIALVCEKLNNFTGVMEILTALHSTPVIRLTKTWQHLSPETYKHFQALTQLMHPSRNFRNYRRALKKLGTSTAAIPYLPAFLVELVLIDETNTDTKDQGQLINFDKARRLAKKILEFQRWQRQRLYLLSLQPVKHVADYLLNAPILQYNELLALSYDVEEANTGIIERLHENDEMSLCNITEQLMGKEHVPTEENQLTAQDWYKVVEVASLVTFQRNDVIIQEGTYNRYLYRIKSGEVRIEKEVGEGGGSNKSSKITLATMGPDSILGEMSVLDQYGLSSASVIACTDVEAWRLGIKEWSLLFKTEPALAKRFYMNLAQNLAKRLRELPPPKKAPAPPGAKSTELATGTSKKDRKFTKRFGLPKEEVVIKDYRCALGRKRGRLYVSQNYICFFAKFFNAKTKEAIPLSKVSAIEKSKDGQITVTTKRHKYYFKHLKQGEECFHFLQNIWQNSKKSPTATQPTALSSSQEVKAEKEEKQQEETTLSAEEKYMLTKTDWEILLKGAKCETYNRDDVIVKEGQVYQKIYFVSKGTCKVVQTKGNEVVVLGIMGESETFGEISFLDGGPASAAVWAAEDGVELFYVDGHFINVLFTMKPDIAGKFYKYLATVIASRLRLREGQTVKAIDESSNEVTAGSILDPKREYSSERTGVLVSNRRRMCWVHNGFLVVYSTDEPETPLTRGGSSASQKSVSATMENAKGSGSSLASSSLRSSFSTSSEKHSHGSVRRSTPTNGTAVPGGSVTATAAVAAAATATKRSLIASNTTQTTANSSDDLEGDFPQRKSSNETARERTGSSRSRDLVIQFGRESKEHEQGESSPPLSPHHHNTKASLSEVKAVIALDGCSLRVDSSRNMMKITTTKGSRVFTASSQEELREWVGTIYKWTDAFKQNPHFSYSPVREGIRAKWFVDGEDTFDAIATAMEAAQETIFITDWFLVPEIYLRRHANSATIENRLDRLLLRKAKQGVKIFVILWNETSIAVKLNSASTQRRLNSLHPNILVLRHPPLNALQLSWSHHQKIVVVDMDLAFIGGLDLCYGRWDTHRHRIVDDCHLQLCWPGLDYINPRVRGITKPEKPFTEHIDRNEVPRMAWHDIHMAMDGWAARDVAKNFIQRWNHHKESNGESSVPYIMIKTCDPLCSSSSLLSAVFGEDCSHSNTVSIQLIRSIAEWSGGNRTETSIYRAYLDVIDKAQHFIYIENQYFISSLAGGGVKNVVVEHIAKRVELAITRRETFRVVVVLPVNPDGAFDESASIRYIMQWQYSTISRGGTSLLERLQQFIERKRKEAKSGSKEEQYYRDLQVSDFVSFHALRSFGTLNGRYVTEQVYVHCKLMIVDDRVVIIGSANLNDRSFKGDRDSEIAAVIRDTDMIESQMAGKPFAVSRFAHTLRQRLWREHLGLLEDDGSPSSSSDVDVGDPVVSSIYEGLWRATAMRNTNVFDKLFEDIPQDAISTLDMMTTKSSEEEEEERQRRCERELRKVKGHLVFFPLNFLNQENLRPGTKNIAIRSVDRSIFQ